MTLDAFFELQKGRIGKTEKVDPNRKHVWSSRERIPHDLGANRQCPQIKADYKKLRMIYD